MLLPQAVRFKCTPGQQGSLFAPFTKTECMQTWVLYGLTPPTCVRLSAVEGPPAKAPVEMEAGSAMLCERQERVKAPQGASHCVAQAGPATTITLGQG